MFSITSNDLLFYGSHRDLTNDGASLESVKVRTNPV
jgi:hypothetical protein